MRDHIKILGILNIVMGGLTALAGIIVFLAMGGLAGFLAMGVPDTSSQDAESARAVAPFMGLIGGIVAVFLLAIGFPAILGGWGLLKFKSWSRVLMLVISGLHLLSVPFGTALGIYGLWVLLKDQSTQLLESGGTMPPVGYAMPQQPAPAPGFPGAQPPQST
jgi:hypothetical protein